VLKPGEVHVWRARLDLAGVPASESAKPTPGEAARAARFHSEDEGRRYLRSHLALRAILGSVLGGILNSPAAARLEFAVTEKGKPYLPFAPEVRFSLSRSRDLALIALALGMDVGVDVERMRPMPDCLAVAARFFPPSEAAALQETPAERRELEFFRRWTRIEAVLKARGIGLHGAGEELEGPWTVREVDVGPGFAGAVAAQSVGLVLMLHEFGANE
jgi:4'-phosphopantetheinyl transferase